jgi:osmotically-inducible protein OsmY
MRFAYLIRKIKNYVEPGTLAIFLSIFLILPVSGRAQEMDDTKVSYAVENQLIADEGVPAHLINVQAKDGIVSLSGNVNNLMAKERAGKVAETVKGVKAVINKIYVREIDRSDEAIANDATMALFEDPATEAYEVDVIVRDGKAILSGRVQSRQEKMLAEQVVRGVRGIREIENNIEIFYKATRADEEIKADVRRRLESDVWVDDQLIQIEVNNGNVILTGMVGSAAEHEAARRDAWVTGTKSVNTSMLEINWNVKDDMQRHEKYVGMTDDEIETAVENAFAYDPRVSLFDIIVSVDSNVVTLMGTVNNLKAKMAAEDDAENTVGVYRVKNHIKVRPETIPAGRDLEARVLKALARDPYVEIFDVEVEALDGKVSLSGNVHTSFEKQHASDIARKVKGVIEIDNMLEYQHAWAPKSDIEIEQDVADKLYWDPFINSERVEVKVDEGVVTLEGKVRSWLEYTEAEKKAYQAGAKDVRNNLVITTLSMYELKEKLDETDREYLEADRR